MRVLVKLVIGQVDRALVFCCKLMALISLLFFCATTHAGEIKLYAAASLTDALTELSTIYQAAHPNTAIKLSFAGSPTLAKQIAHGAPADLLIAADDDWLDYLAKRNLLLDASRRKLLSNDLVLIAPITSDNKIMLAPGFDLAASFQGRLCTGDTTSVPVGKYAKQALQYYGWWAAISPRIVGADDVRAALVFVERAECSLGIVYKSDALLSKKVKVLATFPSASHRPIIYPAVLLQHAVPETTLFFAFLQSEEAAAVFSRYGFQPSH